MIWMAGSGEPGDAVLRRQTADLSKAAGGSDATIAQILAAHRALTEAIKAGADLRINHLRHGEQTQGGGIALVNCA